MELVFKEMTIIYSDLVASAYSWSKAGTQVWMQIPHNFEQVQVQTILMKKPSALSDDMTYSKQFK